MKIVFRDPPILLLVAAIMCNWPLRKVQPRDPTLTEAPTGWAAQKLIRWIELREADSRRAT